MSEIKFNNMQPGRNPFKVPEGYFDHFADDFMAALPDRLTIVQYSWWHRYRYAVASVACFVALVLVSALYVGHFQQNRVQTVAEQHAIDVSIDEMADYAMYDKGDMYASLCEN